MPSASANISAKFIAQIEIGASRVPRKRTPAEAIRPTIVSISGRPAATSEPKARTRIASVTGQEISSDFSIASRLASLKSDHMPAAPVRLASTPGAATPASFGLEVVGCGDHLVRALGGVPARTTAVWPSREIETPGRGGVTAATAGSAARTRSTRARVRRKAGAVTVRSLRVDGDLQRVGAGAGEVAVDLFAHRHRLRAVRLPAGARERGLDPRRQHAEADCDHRPGDEDRAPVGRREAAEPPDRAQVAHRSQAAWTPKATQHPGAGAVAEGDEGELVEGDEAGQQQEPGADERAPAGR